MESSSRRSKFVKIGQKYGTLYAKNKVVSIFSDNFNLQKVPLFKGSCINFLMLAEYVNISRKRQVLTP
jgi:hypothetical protein